MCVIRDYEVGMMFSWERVDVTDDWDDVQLGQCAEGGVTGADVNADVTQRKLTNIFPSPKIISKHTFLFHKFL